MEYGHRERLLRLFDRTSYMLSTNGRVLTEERFVLRAKGLANDLYPTGIDKQIRHDIGQLHYINALTITPSGVVQESPLTPTFRRIARQYR